MNLATARTTFAGESTSSVQTCRSRLVGKSARQRRAPVRIKLEFRRPALSKLGPTTVLFCPIAGFGDDLGQLAWFTARPTVRGSPIVRGLATAFILFATGSIAVADPGDAEKAKQMLARVVVAVERDPNAAVRTFNAGAEGFKDGNIYPFCFRVSDGVVVTGQTAGSDIRTFPGSGHQIFEAAQKPEGEMTEITYLAKKPPPAEATPVKKVSLVRRIGQFGCGVGYYP